jgi:hypothetical protein
MPHGGHEGSSVLVRHQGLLHVLVLVGMVVESV